MIKLTNIKAIFFDLDGTLVDSANDIAQAVNLTLQQHQLPTLATALIKNMIGKGSEKLLYDVLTHLQLTDKAQEHKFTTRMYADYLHNYQSINGQYSSLYPTVSSSLHQLKQHKFTLVCITNKPQHLAIQLLENKAILSYFSLVFGGDSFAYKKPHPMPLLESCQALQISPSQAIMVGDSINDAQAARNAGCHCALLPYGYNQGQDIKQMGADLIIENLAQLVTLAIN